MSRFDVTDVKQAAQGRWREILPSVTGIDPNILDPKKHFPCPKCGGTDRFRVFDDFKSTGGIYCNGCHAEKNGDGFATIQWLAGCTFPESLRMVAVYLGIAERNGRSAQPLSDDQFLESLCAAKKMPVASAKLYGAKVTTWGNANGERVVVFPVYDQIGPPCGRFAISHLSKDETLGKGKFAKGATHGLFLPHDDAGKPRLPQAGEHWLQVEGVKDAAALHGLGYLAAGLPTSNMSKKFSRLFRGVFVIVVPDLDEAGQKGAQQTASRLKGIAASIKIARLPGELTPTGGLDCRDVLAGPDGEAQLRLAIADAIEWTSGKARAADDNRPVVLISTDEFATNDAAAAQLANDPELFQRGGKLVCVATGDDDDGRIHRAATQPRIVEVGKPGLRERLSAICYFVTEVEGEQFPSHPPDWCVKAIHDRGQWSGVRQLAGVTASPIVRPDGTVQTERGYDQSTGLYLASDWAGVEVPGEPTQSDAQLAVGELLDVVCDFPFEQPQHRSAWLSTVITPLARPTFDGPVPLHLIDAPAPGSGKTLLADISSYIQTGDAIARMSNPLGDEEARKRITAIAISGDAMVLIDNVNGGLGCSALDAALTGTRWRDRVLGASQMIDLPLLATWLASGNNVVLRGDTSRRALHIRLRPAIENPESRTGFRHPRVLAHVRAHRARLLSAALTILRAWFVAGRPQAKLQPWGSFEEWSSVVRQALVFAGQPDPAETRQEFVSCADQELTALRTVLECWHQIDEDARGLTAGEIAKAIDNGGSQSIREALLELIPPSGAAPVPSVRQIGTKLSHLRGRIVGGRTFDYREARGRTRLWFVADITTPTKIEAINGQNGDSGVYGDSYLTQYMEKTNIPPIDTGEGNKDFTYRGPGEESPQPPESPSITEVDESADGCPKCGHPETIEVSIHGGSSLRRDCARCGHTICFTKWEPATAVEVTA